MDVRGDAVSPAAAALAAEGRLFSFSASCCDAMSCSSKRWTARYF